MWVFGGVAASRERNKADQQLVRKLNKAVTVYSDRIELAQKRVVKLARKPNVGDALKKRNGGALREIERHNPGIVLSTRRTPLAPGTVTLANVVVSVRGDHVGRVRAVVPLRDLAPGQNGWQLGLLRGQRLELDGKSFPLRSTPPLREPVDLTVGSEDTRAVAVRLPGRDAALITFRERSDIAARASNVRWKVVGIGLGLIAALLVIAYAVAPAIARSRLSRQQRDEAERVLAHLGDGVFVVDHHGVVRLWNQAAEAITGLRTRDVRGQKADDSIPGWATIAALVPVADRPEIGRAHV